MNIQLSENHVSQQFEAWYNTERPNEARGHLPPEIETEPEKRTTVRRGDVVHSIRLDGALKLYPRRAEISSNQATFKSAALSI